VIEGWHSDDYLIIFAESEIDPAANRYGVSERLPGFQLLGLRSWDDFIVKDPNGWTFSIPTVPFDSKYLEPFTMPSGELNLQSDARFVGKIKWYLTPLVFGGDAKAKENCMWINHEQHAQLVRFWNDKYSTLKNSERSV
jgi:hypothetical protein